MDELNNTLLEDFRRQWQDEISAAQIQRAFHDDVQTSDADQGTHQGSSFDVSGRSCGEKLIDIGQGSGSRNADISPVPKDNNTSKIDAREVYMLAVKHEQSGELVQAIKLYKKALQLDPDVEQQIYAETRKELAVEVAKNLATIKITDDTHHKEQAEIDEKGDLFARFLANLHQDGRTCFPLEDPKDTHISALPHEVLIHILKWVVSSDLDLRSLEQVSLVCRGLYVCARDIELWKQACFRIWGNTEKPTVLGYNNFREMYIQRPHVWFHGCYISKASYVRRGENSFQDIDYQPWHLVNYYRYLRFFSDGVALMLTTADDPATAVGNIQRKKRHLNQGHYTLTGNRVNLIFKRKTKPPETTNQYRRRKRNEINNNASQIVEQIFRMELEIGSAKKKLHGNLRWVNYTVENVYSGKDPTVSDFDVHPTKFPPFWFSRVRSYNSESELPL